MINHDLKKVLFLKDQIKNKSLNIIRVAMLKKILFTEKVISNTGKNDFQYLQKLLHFCIYIRQKKSQKESNLRRWIEIIFLCLSNDWNTFNILWKREKIKTVSSYALFKVINLYDINRTNVNTAWINKNNHQKLSEENSFLLPLQCPAEKERTLILPLLLFIGMQ